MGYRLLVEGKELQMDVEFMGAIKIDSPTKRIPTGAKGHQVELPAWVAHHKLSTLIGKPLRYKHLGLQNVRKSTNLDIYRAGIITDAEVKEGWLMVSGFMEKVPTPELNLGLSWEIKDAKIADMDAKVWRIVGLEGFQGVAMTTKPASESWVKIRPCL